MSLTIKTASQVDSRRMISPQLETEIGMTSPLEVSVNSPLKPSSS